jgi:phosphoribosylanthranilate isomerase
MRAKIKICGITNLSDAQFACGLGADMLGFNFYPKSPRCIDPADAAAIIADLPETCVPVGVVVNPTRDDLRRILKQCPLHSIQLHGDENDDFCRQVSSLGINVIKALRIRTPSDIGRLADYSLNTFLLDAFNENVYGGGGKTFDWNWIAPVAKTHKILLAGGISPDTIEQALRIGTWGIDLCSGVESAPGKKDPEKMKLLFEKIAQFYA